MAKKAIKTEPTELETKMARIRKAADRDYTADQHNRKAALEALEFLLPGGMWLAGDKKLREDAGKPCPEIDRISPAIDQAVGDERQTCPAIKVRAGDSAANSSTAQVIAGKIREIESHSQARLAYTKASEHQKQGGFGYIRVITEYESDDSFDQKISIEPVYNQLAVLFDASAVKQNKEDANHLLIYSKISKATYKQLYDKEPTSLEISGENGFQWRTDEEVVIGEWYEKEFDKKVIYQLKDGSVTEDSKLLDNSEPILDKEGNPTGEFNTSSPYELDDKGKPRQREVNSYKIYCTKIDGANELEPKQLWPSKFWPIIPVYGKALDVNGKTYYRGIVQKAMDSNRLYNYYSASAIEQYALAKSAPWIVTVEMIHGHEQEWADADRKNAKFLTINSIDTSNPGNIIWPQRQLPPVASSAITQGLQQSADDIRTTTGRHLASLGAQGNETSGVAITARQKEGDVGDYAFTDNTANAIKQVGRVIVDLIPAIYDTNRTIKTLEVDGTSKEVEINKPGSLAEDNPDELSHRGLVHDLGVGKYEVEIDIGPSYTTQRQETSQSMIVLIQADPSIAPVLIDDLVKSQDWPGAEAASWKLKAAKLKNGMGFMLTPEEKAEIQRRFPPDQQDNQPPPPDPNMVRVQMERQDKQARLQMDMDLHELKRQQMLADIEKTRADGIKSIALAEAAEAGSQIKGYEAILNGLGISLGHVVNQQKMGIEAAKLAQIGGEGGGGTPQTPTSTPSPPDMGNGPDMSGEMSQVSPEAPPGGGVSGLMPIPGRAGGGPVQEGQPYVVGERGPEVIVPQGDGVVIPNPQMTIQYPQTTPTFNPEQYYGEAVQEAEKFGIAPPKSANPQDLYEYENRASQMRDQRITGIWPNIKPSEGI